MKIKLCHDNDCVLAMATKQQKGI